jgi:glycosyltransferase involved in cell wall biosynthesis
MPRHQPLVAFDFSGLDHLDIGNGQYRYCVDLINGLARLSSGFRFVVIGSRPDAPEEIRDVFDAEGWRYAHFAPSRFRGGAYVDQIRFALWLRRQRAALLHVPHTFLPQFSQVPTVVTIYDMMSELFPEYHERVVSRPYQRFKRAMRRRHPVAMAISQTTADDLQRLWGFPGPKIRVVHLGTDPVAPPLQPPAALANLVNRKFILSPYNLEPRKNLRTLLFAAATVRKVHPDVQLVLYGRAAVTRTRETQFQRDVEASGLGDAVVLTGFIPPHDLAFLLAHAALFVFPSLYEGFGLPVLEAMAAGACTVARNRSAMAEVLGDSGVLIETKDPVLLATTIRGLLDDTAKRAALGSAARTRAAQFSRDRMVRGTLACYWSALERQ